MINCLPYFGIFALVFFLNTLAMRQRNRFVRNLLIILGFLGLLFFIGFRFEVGTDYDAYLRHYNIIREAPWNKIFTFSFEPLTALVFKICSLVIWDERLIFVVLGFLMLWPIYKVNKIYEYKYLAYSVLLFCVLFLPFGLNGMRQGVALGFTLLCVVYCMKGNLLSGVFSFLASILFHTSAWVVLPYVIGILVSKRRGMSFTKFNVLITSSISLLVLFFLNGFLMNLGVTRYDYILDSLNVEMFSLNALIIYIPLLSIILFLKSYTMSKDEKNVLKNLSVSGFVFYVVGTVAQYLTRFAYYFMFSNILLVPELIQSVQEKKTRLVIKALFLLYLGIFFFVQYSLRGWHEILPYQTWIFGG